MRTIATSALLAVATTLGACAGGPVNQTVYSANQPVVSRSDYVYDVNADGVGYSEEARIVDWFDTLDLGYGDRVSIDDPNPYGSAERRNAVAAIVARYGLLLADRAPITAGQVQPGTMRIVVSRMTAEVPTCPNWDRRSNGQYAGSSTSNYGCAINGNVAAMVANPEDLVRGQSGSAYGDPRTSTRAINSYRSQNPTGEDGLEEITTTGGN